MNAYSESFNKFIPWLYSWEGIVYENDPDDPGGATKFGIDKASHPNVDIKNLTADGAKQIYWDSYWNAVHAEELPTGVREVVANIGVNAGKRRAAEWLQAAVGAVVDGNIGPNTIALANAMDAKVLATKLLDRTEQHYRSIAKGTLSKFLTGWLNRNNDLRKLIGI